jgi:hypothetical protein
MARYRKEDHAKKKPAAPKAKKPAAAKSKAPSSTGRTRKPVDPKAPAVGQAMQDAAADPRRLTLLALCSPEFIVSA